jgi:MurNAc alpha-1-phosphate uridylyltransferase
MKAMILAAGRGERLRPLTDSCPKPLLTVQQKPLMQYHIEQLARLGVNEFVVNLAWLGEQIRQYFGDGQSLGVQIRYSEEFDGVLETAGGIKRALALLTKGSALNDDPFLVINGDVFCDIDYSLLLHRNLATETLAHLVLVPNPCHHPQGDFVLTSSGQLSLDDTLTDSRYTYSGIGLYRPSFFSCVPEGKQPLAPWLKHFIAQGKVSAQLYQGFWCDVGTPERLAALNHLTAH